MNHQTGSGHVRLSVMTTDQIWVAASSAWHRLFQEWGVWAYISLASWCSDMFEGLQ